MRTATIKETDEGKLSVKSSDLDVPHSADDAGVPTRTEMNIKQENRRNYSDDD